MHSLMNTEWLCLQAEEGIPVYNVSHQFFGMSTGYEGMLCPQLRIWQVEHRHMVLGTLLLSRLGPCAALRSIDKKLAKASKLPAVRKTWTVEDKLGGWGVAQDKFFAGKARSRSLLGFRVEGHRLGGWRVVQNR